MLSVIKNPQSKGKHYSEWKAEKEHKPTIRSLIKADVDGNFRIKNLERVYIYS